MKTLVLSLAIKDDDLHGRVVEMLSKHLKEMGLSIFQQAGPGITILNGAQMEEGGKEAEKEKDEEEPASEEPEENGEKKGEEEDETVDEPEIDLPETEESEEAPSESEELPVTSEEISKKEYINGVRSFYLGNDELVAEKGVAESILFVDNVAVDGPYALFKFKNTSYRYPVCESTNGGTFIKLDFYTSEKMFKEVKCLLKTSEGQNFDLVLGANHEK